jgi:hypothetical protein
MTTLMAQCKVLAMSTPLADHTASDHESTMSGCKRNSSLGNLLETMVTMESTTMQLLVHSMALETLDTEPIGTMELRSLKHCFSSMSLFALEHVHQVRTALSVAKPP